MNLKRVDFHRFKRWKSSSVPLRSGLTLVVGGNNSGKSSILHGLALWEFCRTVLTIEKGSDVLFGAAHQGLGMGFDDFTPVPVPSLRHLWTNLRTQKEAEPDGYTLKVKAVWDVEGAPDRELEFGLSLANDRLFVKVTSTNLAPGQSIPRIAYLPPFAGIGDREQRLSPALRRRLVGQGLAGAVLRNRLLDYHEANSSKRQELKAGRTKIRNPDLRELRSSDPWELLIQTVREVFQQDLRVKDFNPAYHTYIRVEACKGTLSGTRFKKFPSYNYRDLMVEGSGFLQWLSVYALAVADDVDVLLLDEPDAHLHCSLQADLTDRLDGLAGLTQKQVVLASHSTEILHRIPHGQVLEVRSSGNPRYLKMNDQKVGVMAGLGAEYAPRIARTQHHKRVLFLEGSSDEDILRGWFEAAGKPWPDNVVIWHWSADAKERKVLFRQLKTEFPALDGLSLRDRDDEPFGTTQESLVDKNHPPADDELKCLKWRRRELENYLLFPEAIARASAAPVADVEAFLGAAHSIVVASAADFRSSEDVPTALRDLDGKAIMHEAADSVEARFGVTRAAVAKAMTPAELPEDVLKCIEHIEGLAS